MSAKKLHWAAPGDVNAFFGLMLDNIADLLLPVGLLTIVFGFPTKFALRHMVPGTAVGVLVGDLLFFWMALRLARRTGRKDITAMPLGLDAPSTFGMVFFVLGPSFVHAKLALGLSEMDAARHAWHIGIWAIVLSGLFKFACAAGSNWVRRLVPRAGLLGSLTAIALVLLFTDNLHKQLMAHAGELNRNVGRYKQLTDSPLPGSPLVNPLQLPENLPGAAAGQTPFYLAAAYLPGSCLPHRLGSAAGLGSHDNTNDNVIPPPV